MPARGVLRLRPADVEVRIPPAARRINGPPTNPTSAANPVATKGWRRIRARTSETSHSSSPSRCTDSAMRRIASASS